MRPGNPKGRSNNDEYVLIAQRHLLPNGGPNEGGREGGRDEVSSAAFALKSAHALASPGSTHFSALGVDADALLSPAAVLYLLRFSGDVVTAEQTFVTGVVTPVRVVAAEILVTLAEVVRVDVVRPAPVRLAIICLAVLRGGSDR